MAYFLGVDAGGTKTDYVLADEAKKIASVRTGSIKRLRVSSDAAEQNLLTALDALRQQTGIDLANISVSCIGAAGSSVPLVANWLRSAFSRHVGGELLLLEDVEIALDAAFFGRAGVLVLAGTGSNIAGRSPDGRLTTAGGWGPALADYGSGYSLGQAALKECFLAIDEGRDTLLLQEILSFWNLSSIAALVEKANCDPRPDVSQLAAIVGKCAENSDDTAHRVIQQEAAALAHLTGIVIDRIHQQNASPTWIPEVAFTGSIMKYVLPMRQAVEHLIVQSTPQAQLRPGVIQPSDGALWRARNWRLSQSPQST